MTTSISSPSILSEPDDEVDDADADLFPNTYGLIHASCLSPGNFVLHLQEQDSHKTTVMTPAGCRTIEKE